MGAMSRTEINLQRLLRHCETMATDAQHKEEKVNWRLSKYLKTVEDQICKLETDKNMKLEDEILSEYKRKVTFLKDVVRSEETEDPLERILLCQHLLPTSVISNTSREKGNENNEGGQQGTTKGLHLQMKGKHKKDLRKQLLGESDKQHPHSLNRRDKEEATTKDSIDEILKQHHDMQERVAEEMILMTQSMKQTQLRSRDIIKKDKQELERSNKLVDQNFQKLKVESDRLEEMNKRRCAWTIWIMLGVVCVVFINMIIFIKLFPKKRGY